MLRRILGTVGTRYLVALFNLMLIFINAKVLGVEGVGTIGLILASVNIAVIFNSLFSGNTLVYFMNRYPIRTLCLPAYGWTVIGSAIACGFMAATGLLPAGYRIDIYLLAILNSLVTANARFLLGKDDVRGFNITYFIQWGLLFFILLYFYYVANKQEIGSYLLGMYITNSLAFAASLWLLLPVALGEKKAYTGRRLYPKLIREMFVYGTWASVDNLAEVFTTRLNYFLVQRFTGVSGVGLLDAGTKIAESVWHISRSVSFITYGQVARTSDSRGQTRIALQLFKFTLVVLVLVMTVILCIPEWVYTGYLFSPEFTGMRRVIIALSPGIIALGSNSILSHFFIGSGRVRLSAGSSIAGLVALCLSGFWLVPTYGVVGGAVSTSIAFIVMLTFSLTLFIRTTGVKALDFLPTLDDFKTALATLRKKN